MNRKIIFAAIGLIGVGLAGGAGVWAWRAGYLASILSKGDVNATAEVAAEQGPPRDGMSKVRTLFGAQDLMVKGEAESINRQSHLIESIGRDFDSFTSNDWRVPKNVQAMTAYVLSGGKTEVIEKFFSTKLATKEQENLLKGVLSFALRRPKTALKQIGEIEVRTLEPPLVGVMSLALASLHASEDTARGVALYDEARLYAPGTAIEESAIRRQVPIMLKDANLERSNSLIARYVRSFGKSPFSNRFYGEVADALAAFDDPKAQAALASIRESLSDESVDRQSTFYIAVARAALLAGKLPLAKQAADNALALGHHPSVNAQRAKFYAAAAMAPTENAGKVLSDLEALSLADLDGDEKEIRTAASAVANSVANAGLVKPDPTPAALGANNVEKLAAKPAALMDATSAVINRADAAVKNADTLLTAEPK